jgi:hypothetical protein
MTSLNGFGRRRWSAIAAGALVTVLAACGSQAKTVEVKKHVAPSPRKVLLASARATTAAKSARMSMKMTASGAGADGFAVTADGVADFTNGDAEFTMHLSGGSQQFGGMEARLVDGAAYLKMPASLGSMFGGGKWLKLPLGAPVGVLPGFDQSDPSKFLAYLETVSNGVKKIGPERIRGVDTTHYKATFDLGKAIDRADVPPALRESLGKLARGNASFKMPADVWVDNDGLARRIALTLDLGEFAGDSPDGDAAPVMAMSIDLYDFGVPVHVEAPPAGDVQAFPEFGPSGASGASGAPA